MCPIATVPCLGGVPISTVPLLDYVAIATEPLLDNVPIATAPLLGMLKLNWCPFELKCCPNCNGAPFRGCYKCTGVRVSPQPDIGGDPNATVPLLDYVLISTALLLDYVPIVTAIL